MLKVLALTVKPIESPDTRYRICQYVDHFRQAGIEVDHVSLFRPEEHRRLGRMGLPLKASLYLWAYLRRTLQILFRAKRYDAIWVLRELTALAPSFMENLLFEQGRPVVLDIDDAIFLPDAASSSLIHHRFRNFSRFERNAPRYQRVVCGNRFLADHFESWGARVDIIPTVVESWRYESVSPSNHPRVRIGWIGTPTNRPHLQMLEKPMLRLAGELDFELVMVGLDHKLDWAIPHMRYLDWELSSEIEFFTHFDIGVMPLLDYEFSKGKCAFKLIQYMAAGLPVVASPVGANADVVRHGVTGFLADTEDEWVEALRLLITDAARRKEIGRQGRRLIQSDYSLEAWWERYARVFKEVARHEH